LVLVTDPEVAEDAYAFDNPCFKDATPVAAGRVTERPSSAVPGDTPAKDSTRWSTSWTSLGLGSVVRSDKRRTLDDSCVGVSLFCSFCFFAIVILLVIRYDRFNSDIFFCNKIIKKLTRERKQEIYSRYTDGVKQEDTD